jgi:hypothetical protein
MAKNQKTTIVTRGMISVSTKSKASSMLTQRVANSVKSGRFAEGVKVASKRDRAGLIKLADR